MIWNRREQQLDYNSNKNSNLDNTMYNYVISYSFTEYKFFLIDCKIQYT